MPKNRKKPTMDEIIYGDGYIIEKGFNPLKKKKIKLFRTSPEQKKEFLIKNKQIQRATRPFGSYQNNRSISIRA